jgi:hypothetical protein
MSATGRPEREYRSAQRVGTPVSATGRPERELRRGLIAECLCERVSFRPPSILADAPFEAWRRPARMDVFGGSAAAELATEAASVGVQ